MATVSAIVPCLWFDSQAEEAAAFYVAILGGSIDAVSRYSEVGREVHGRPVGSVMTVAFTIAGQRFTALNGGPHFTFSEAISMQIRCETQAEIDRLWSALTGDGGAPGVCGWLKDRFGLSWQLVSPRLDVMMTDPDPAKSARVMAVVMQMIKPDLAALERAYAGQG